MAQARPGCACEAKDRLTIVGLCHRPGLIRTRPYNGYIDNTTSYIRNTS
jgi:hypothetical protein